MLLGLRVGMAIGQSGADWSHYYGSSNGWRYSTLKQINKNNVGKLKVVWIHQADDLTGGMQTMPIVVAVMKFPEGR